MNYLAHAYLSFGYKELMVGNLIADFVKGNKLDNYPIEILKGIKLHRAIDRFTDEHGLVKEAKEYLKPEFRLASGIFIDILFDHFLANTKIYFNTNYDLLEFSLYVNNSIQEYKHLLNADMKLFFSYMNQYNWLYNYRTEDGLSKSIHGICKKYPRIGEGENAMKLILKNKSELQLKFEKFYPELEMYSSQWIQTNI